MKAVPCHLIGIRFAHVEIAPGFSVYVCVAALVSGGDLYVFAACGDDKDDAFSYVNAEITNDTGCLVTRFQAGLEPGPLPF